MGIARYSASFDTTITNAYRMNMTTRATGSNMGLADTLEVFSIYGQQASASSELARILIQFPVSGSTGSIGADRDAGRIPKSGSVSFFLRMYNAEHSFTVPKNFALNVSALTKSWQEGHGLDMDEYTDLTYDNEGSNWVKASEGQGDSTSWESTGGDFESNTSCSFSASFEDGTEDIEVDISPLVEQWLSSEGNVLTNKSNHGVIIMFPAASEAATRSYYTKKFFARSSEFALKRPVIEARWDSSTRDDTGNFFLSSSLATGTENLNTIYLYNNIRGRLRNIPVIGNGPILVSIYSGSVHNVRPHTGSSYTLPVGGNVVTDGDFNVTGGIVSTGIYSASFAYTGSATTIFPVWHNISLGQAIPGRVNFHTGSAITVKTFDSVNYNPHPSYVTKIVNLKDTYSIRDKTTRFKLYIREKDWNPNIYTKATSVTPSVVIEDAYYRLYRTTDEFEVVAYGTGSTNHTRLSYDASGSYFDFPMDILESGYMYAFKFIYKMPDGNYREQPEVFKFRVD